MYRRKSGLSQEQLAEKCNLHRTYIGSIERCERNITLSSLELLSNALGVTIAQLLSDNGAKCGTDNESVE